MKFRFFTLPAYGPELQPFVISWDDDQPEGTCAVYVNTGGPALLE